MSAVALPARAATGSVHWARTAGPVTLTYWEGVSDAWAPYVANALNEWTSAAPNVVAFQRVGTVADIEIHSGDFGDTGWSGLTQYSADPVTGHLGHVVVLLNDHYPWMDAAHTACHELGHALGLPHDYSAGEDSCMHESSYTQEDPAFDAPVLNDTISLELTYAHADL